MRLHETLLGVQSYMTDHVSLGLQRNLQPILREYKGIMGKNAWISIKRGPLTHHTYALIRYRLNEENAIIAFIHEHQDVIVLEIKTV